MNKHFLIISITIFFFWSCEKEKNNLVDPSLTEPHILSLSLSQQYYNLDDTTNSLIERLADGTFKITDSLQALISDADGHTDISSAFYRVYAPGSSGYAYQEKLINLGNTLNTSDSANFGAEISFIIERSDIGTFRIEVFARDRSGLVSNIAQIPFSIGLNNRAPIVGAPSIRLYNTPGFEFTRFTFAVPVSDSDGIRDIASVITQPLFALDTAAQGLYDDGASDHGDQIAGDGIFSTILWIDTGSVRTIAFDIFGIDKAGALSNIVQKTLNNHAPTIIDLITPDSIQIPTSGVNIINFFISVQDSEGLADIDSVYFQNLNSTNPNNRFLMFDDGNLAVHGDSTASDGVFSLKVQITPTNTPGVKEFHFYAVDKGGAWVRRIKFITIHN